MEGCSPPAAEQPQETTVSGRGGVPSEGAGEEFLPAASLVPAGGRVGISANRRSEKVVRGRDWLPFSQ